MIMSQSPLRSTASASFEAVLHASGPDRDREAKLALYAWLVGSWDIEIITFMEDGTTHEGRGEIHAGWVLQGRAIQDVWMIPRLKERKPGRCQGAAIGMARRFAFTTQIWTPGASCGTTLRQTFSRSRLGERGLTTSCRKAKIQEAAPCAGHSPKSNQTRFTGRLNVRQTKRLGAAKSISARAGLVERASLFGTAVTSAPSAGDNPLGWGVQSPARIGRGLLGPDNG